MKSIKQIKILPAREQVANTVKKAIFSGELKQGQEITLEEIANKVGVSSMPVREAFQILANDGFLELRPRKGAVVIGMSEKMIIDHFKTRALLEGECCALASQEDTDTSKIIESYNRAKLLVEQGNYAEYTRLNYEFHLEIWNASGNTKIVSILKSMWNSLSIRHRITAEEYAKNSFAEHGEILELIKSHKGEQARKAMNNHLMRSLDGILLNFINKDSEYLKMITDEFVSFD